jgi:hypothetical protein
LIALHTIQIITCLDQSLQVGVVRDGDGNLRDRPNPRAGSFTGESGRAVRLGLGADGKADQQGECCRQASAQAESLLQIGQAISTEHSFHRSQVGWPDSFAQWRQKLVGSRAIRQTRIGKFRFRESLVRERIKASFYCYSSICGAARRIQIRNFGEAAILRFV